MHALTVAHVRMQAQNANMDGGMLDLYPSPADLRKQQVADIQAKRQEKVPPPPLISRRTGFNIQHHAHCKDSRSVMQTQLELGSQTYNSCVLFLQ